MELAFQVDKPCNYTDVSSDLEYVGLLDEKLRQLYKSYKMPCVFNIVTDYPGNKTANLMGPLFLDFETNTGIQPVNISEMFTTKEAYIK